MVPIICEGLLCIEDAFEKGREELFEAPRTVKETALEEGWRLSWDADLNGGGNDPIWICPRCVEKLEEDQNKEIRERNGHSGTASWDYPVRGRSRRPRPPFPEPGLSISPSIDRGPDYLGPDPSGLVNVQTDDPLAEPPLVDPRTGMIARREVWEYPRLYPVSEPDLVSVFRAQQEGREGEWASGSVSPSVEPGAEVSNWDYPWRYPVGDEPEVVSAEDQLREIMCGYDELGFPWNYPQDLEGSPEEVERIGRLLVEAERAPFVTSVSDSNAEAEALSLIAPTEAAAELHQAVDRLGVSIGDFRIQLSETARESIERFEQSFSDMRASIAATAAVPASCFEGLAHLISTGIEEEEGNE